VVDENVPLIVSTTVILCGFRTALLVFTEISQPLKVTKLVKFTLRVSVPPGAGRVCSLGTIERQAAPDGQGPGNGPPP
jgi:hypothetical protein